MGLRPLTDYTAVWPQSAIKFSVSRSIKLPIYNLPTFKQE